MDFTVFTTTYNRKDLLGRLYKSLQRQTNKKFIWLIVDDGSNDGTKEEVDCFKSENCFPIEYYYKENGGKHTAMKIGFCHVHTKYMIDIDDDDELLPNCIETFAKEWENVECENRSDIGSILASAIDEKGKFLGSRNKYMFSVDSNYIDMDWSNGNNYEYIISRKTSSIRDVNVFCDEGKWLYDNVSLISESLYWNRLARKYNSRYIFIPLRIYHIDTADRYTRMPFSRQKCYNYVFSLYSIMNELKDDAFKNPLHLMKYLAEYLSCGVALNIDERKLLEMIDSRVLKFCGYVLFPAAYIVGGKIRKSW